MATFSPSLYITEQASRLKVPLSLEDVNCIVNELEKYWNKKKKTYMINISAYIRIYMRRKIDLPKARDKNKREQRRYD